jgi:hypothetical protein
MSWARRDFLKLSGLAALATSMPSLRGLGQTGPDTDTRAGSVRSSKLHQVLGQHDLT